jgi:hypothetical protein
MLDDFNQSNQTGRFRQKGEGIDTYGNPKRNIRGYFITTPGGLVERPPDVKKSFLSLLQDECVNDPYSVERDLSDVFHLIKEIGILPEGKRKAEAVLAASCGNNKKAKASTLAAAAPGSASATIWVESYWDSPEAKKL